MFAGSETEDAVSALSGLDHAVNLVAHTLESCVVARRVRE